jgi:hypothetical protein
MLRSLEPFLRYFLTGRWAGAPLSRAEILLPVLTRHIAPGTKRLIVFLTPGWDVRAGGVLSIAAIYHESARLRDLHQAKVVLCGVPGDDRIDPLFLKYSWFENSHYVLRLHSVLRSCKDLEYLQIHIPEYTVNRVRDWLMVASSRLLRNVRELHLNILLQNIDQIQGQDVGGLVRFGKVTATTAHEAYSSLATREALGVPLHRLGVCNGPELYSPSIYQDKKPILVVSHDEHHLKEQVLRKIARVVPELRIQVIQNMAYEEYRKIVSCAKWSLTFGEGLDAYFLDMIFSGGVAFAVFNERFFTPAFAKLPTVYSSWDTLMDRLVLDLQRLDEPTAYNQSCRQAYDLLTGFYSTDRFRERLRAFYCGKYTFP